MAQLYLWRNFYKKKNSTKQPTGEPLRVEVTLKNATSLEAPVFLIHGIDFEYNYCAFQNHFYFINDIVVGNNNVYELHCEQDVLATYKGDIGVYTAYVERSASDYNNFINDPAITAQQAIKHSSYVQTGFTWIDNGGCYVLRTVGQSSNSGTTGVNTYALDAENLRKVLNYAFNPSNFADVITDNVVKSFFNPFQYIVSVKWFPMKAVTIGAGANTVFVQLGWWRTDAIAYPVNNLGWISAFNALHFPAPYYSDFRKNNPNFTKYSIYIPSIGNFDLDPLDVKEGLGITWQVDYMTGQCIVQLNRNISDASSDGIIASMTGKFAADIQIGQIATDMKSAVGSGVGALGSLISGNIITAGASLINGVQNILQPTPSLNGSNGTVIDWKANPNVVISEVAYGSMEIPLAEYGRPCCKNVRIDTLQGYVKCANASIECAGLANDKNEINNYLNGGFYYE